MQMSTRMITQLRYFAEAEMIAKAPVVVEYGTLSALMRRGFVTLAPEGHDAILRYVLTDAGRDRAVELSDAYAIWRKQQASQQESRDMSGREYLHFAARIKATIQVSPSQDPITLSEMIADVLTREFEITKRMD